MSLSAPTLTLGSQALGTTSGPLTETVTNTGTGNLTISTVTITGTNPSDFTKSADTCTGVTFVAHGTCSVSLTFTPLAAGSRSATLNFTDNAANSPQAVTLTGTGIAPVVSLSPPSLSFGIRTLGTTSGALAETLTNTGTANLTIVTAAIGGTNAGDFAKSADTCTGATLVPNGTCSVSVKFTPPVMGNRSASLSFTDNASGSPQTIALAGTGTIPLPFINQPLVPTSVAPGGAGFTLTVNGTNFLSGATINWNGAPLVTAFVSGEVLTATVQAAAIASPETASISVVNPGSAVISNVVFFPVAPATTTVNFSPANGSPLAAGINPGDIAAGDFNGDGKLDLAVTNSGSNNLTILLGNGDGTFTPAALSPATGGFPFAVALGDFNGDGKLDLAVANATGNNLTILLGNGDGTFTPATSSPATGNTPFSIAMGDFNGDGKLDLAAANSGGKNLTVLLGNGDGTFTAAASSPPQGAPRFRLRWETSTGMGSWTWRWRIRTATP